MGDPLTLKGQVPGGTRKIDLEGEARNGRDIGDSGVLETKGRESFGG